MMHRSPDAPVAVNHVVAVGPAVPSSSAVSMDLYPDRDQFQLADSLARDVGPGSPQAPFSTNVAWERHRSVEQDNTSVWDQEAQPFVDVPVASSSTTAAQSSLSAEPADDEDVPMQDGTQRQPRAACVLRSSERFIIPPVVPTGAAARAHLINRCSLLSVGFPTVHDVSESYNLEDGQLDADPFDHDAVPMPALDQILVKTCYDDDDSDDDGQGNMVLLTPTAVDNYQFDIEFPLPTLPRNSFADAYSGYSYDMAKDNHCVPPKSIIPFDDLYQDFNTDPIDPAVDYSVFPPLSPSTLRQLEEFIATNGYALSPTTACVDPALLGVEAPVPQPSWAGATLQSLNDLFNLPVIAEPTTLARIDNTDINTAVNLVDSDTESTTSTDSDDESCNIETNDIIRHVWRGPNLRYIFHHNGERLTLSADQMDMRFSGVKSALWGYWRTKSPKRMNQQKLFAYFKRHGVAGCFSEMLWHLLPDVNHYQLIALRRKNRLHEWKW
ncbi:hypothetical protein NCC49_000569 [Naganishia albida]|nr:hypothetical protein NCC49_000569 [Naganishia albida]